MSIKPLSATYCTFLTFYVRRFVKSAITPGPRSWVLKQQNRKFRTPARMPNNNNSYHKFLCGHVLEGAVIFILNHYQVLEEGNETMVISSVTFAPVPEDDGTFLKCLGDNPKLPGFSQEDSFKLNVVCEYPALKIIKPLLLISSRIINSCVGIQLVPRLKFTS